MIPLSPVTPVAAICLGCSKPMRLEVESFKNGKLSRLVMYCDTCKYGHEPSMIHIPGQTVKYVPPQPASGGNVAATPTPGPEKEKEKTASGS